VTPRILALLRAAVSASLLILLLSRTSLEELAVRASAGALLPLASALLLVLLTATLVALRLRTMARCFGVGLPWMFTVRAVFVGMFGGQVLPATLGTDFLRGWLLAQHTGSIRRAASSIIADRLVALFAACVLAAFAYPLLGPFAGYLIAAAIIASAAVLAGFLILNPERSRRQLAPVLGAVLLALAIHTLFVLVAATTAAAYGVEASPRVWLSIVPVSLIASAVPLSINGWGVREGVIVALAAQHGISQPDALVVSLTLGMLGLLASLPGAYLMLGHAK
jgi:hypothetical protein